MRSWSITQGIVVALCACTLAAEQPAQTMYGDIVVLAAEEPAGLHALAGDSAGVWVPAENVTATWESLTAMSKLFNPAAPGAGTASGRSLSLAARVDVVDVNGLLGFDYNAQGTLVLDEEFRVVYSKAVPSKYCHFYWPLRYTKKMVAGQWVSELQPYRLTVDMPLDPNRPYPARLGRVEWSMYTLLSTGSKTVDVPFSPAADWVTLTPGVEIKVEQATAESGKYQYRIATRYYRNQVMWATSGAATMIWTSDPTPEVIVTKLDILDAQGKSLKDGGSSSGSTTSGSTAGGSGGDSPSGGASAPARRGSDGSVELITIAADDPGPLTTGTTSGMGSHSSGGVATTFRFTLALQPRQQQLRFILENVPVPLL